MECDSRSDIAHECKATRGAFADAADYARVELLLNAKPGPHGRVSGLRHALEPESRNGFADFRQGTCFTAADRRSF